MLRISYYRVSKSPGDYHLDKEVEHAGKNIYLPDFVTYITICDLTAVVVRVNKKSLDIICGTF